MDQKHLEGLQEQKNKLAAEIKQFHADNFDTEKGVWKDGEDREGTWNTLNKKIDDLSDEIGRGSAALKIENRLKMLDEQAGELNVPANMLNAIRGGGQAPIGDRRTPEDLENTREMAFTGWMRAQYGLETTKEMDEAQAQCNITERTKQLKFSMPSTQWLNGLARAYRTNNPNQWQRPDFYNAPMTTTPGVGGETVVPESLVRNLERAMLDFSGMAQVSDYIVTNTGETLSWPTSDDTANEGRIVAEAATVDNSGTGDTPIPTSKTSWGAHKYTSGVLLISYELLEDNVVQLGAQIGSMLGERLGRAQEEGFTNGGGTTEPTGILTAAPTGVTTAGPTAITPEEIVDLQHSVDPAYRAGAGFMANDAVWAYVRKLKQNDQFWWSFGATVGAPDMLLGSPVFRNQKMPSAVSTGNDTMIFGQLSKYKIRRVNGFRFYRLVERYRDRDLDGFLLMMRQDGNLLDAGTNPVKKMTQA